MAQVGRKMSKPQSYASKVANGERKLDSVELARFAQVYNREVGWFLEGCRVRIGRAGQPWINC